MEPNKRNLMVYKTSHFFHFPHVLCAKPPKKFDSKFDPLFPNSQSSQSSQSDCFVFLKSLDYLYKMAWKSAFKKQSGQLKMFQTTAWPYKSRNGGALVNLNCSNFFGRFIRWSPAHKIVQKFSYLIVWSPFGMYTQLGASFICVQGFAYIAVASTQWKFLPSDPCDVDQLIDNSDKTTIFWTASSKSRMLTFTAIELKLTKSIICRNRTLDFHIVLIKYAALDPWVPSKPPLSTSVQNVVLGADFTIDHHWSTNWSPQIDQLITPDRPTDHPRSFS